jgi:hypothetical protein
LSSIERIAARRPDAGAAAPVGRAGHRQLVELLGDRLEPAAVGVVGEDLRHHLGLLLVHHCDRVLAERAVGLADELVSVAPAARDAPGPDLGPQRLRGARPDRLELELMTGTLDVRGRLLDGVRERHLVPGHVVEQPAVPVLHQLADHQRHLQRIAPEPALVADHDDVAGPGVGDQAL